MTLHDGSDPARDAESPGPGNRIMARLMKAALAIDDMFVRPDSKRGFAETFDSERMEQRLKDFVQGGLNLFWRRQGMFLGVAAMTAYFYDPWLAAICYAVCIAAESLDLYLTMRILNDERREKFPLRHYVAGVTLCQVFSAFSISLFAVVISWYEGPTFHFTPLFLLFAAALFAAVNNHQLPQLILLKLTIYGLTFLFIPLRDLIIERPPLNSYLWLQFITVAFVLYFIIDCSRIFVQLYRMTLDQLDVLKIERDRAMQAAEAKAQFLSTVSHELKTPLTSIKGSLDLIESGGFGAAPEAMQPLIGLAGKNSERLLVLINDLLDLQSMDRSDLTFRFTDVDLWRLAEEATSFIADQARSAGVAIVMEGQRERAAVRGDHSRLLQVMANLLSNAIKFSESGTTVRVRVERIGDKAKVSIRDQGVGIAAQDRDMVFEPFFQADSSDTRAIGGAGLGMSISRRIIDQHEATIDFISAPGAGTTFFMVFDLLEESGAGAETGDM